MEDVITDTLFYHISELVFKINLEEEFRHLIFVFSRIKWRYLLRWNDESICEKDLWVTMM